MRIRSLQRELSQAHQTMSKMVGQNRVHRDCMDIHTLRRQTDVLRKRNRALIDALEQGSSDQDQQLQEDKQQDQQQEGHLPQVTSNIFSSNDLSS